MSKIATWAIEIADDVSCMHWLLHLYMTGAGLLEKQALMHGDGDRHRGKVGADLIKQA